MAEGARLHVLDGTGHVAHGILTHASKTEAHIEYDETTFTEQPTPRIILVQALIKNNRMDWIIQKMVELGVAELYPFWADRADLKAEQAGKTTRQTRMNAIAMSALKQSGHTWLPTIHPSVSLEDSIAKIDADAHLFYGSIEAPAKPFRNALRNDQTATPKICVPIVGPVGDLSPREYEWLRTSKAIPVSLGQHILRVETASLFMISAIRYEYENQ